MADHVLPIPLVSAVCAPTVTTYLPDSKGYEISLCDRIGLTVKNTDGANAIGTLQLEYAPDGINYDPLPKSDGTTNYGSLAAGAHVTILINEYTATGYLRISATSTLGASCTVQGGGVRTGK